MMSTTPLPDPARDDGRNVSSATDSAAAANSPRDPQSVQAVQSLRALREKVAKLQGTSFESGQEIVSSGNRHLDRLLPRGGFARGTLVEWIAQRPRNGAATLALFAAQEAAKQGGYVVVLDRQRQFYPPAAAAWGLSLRRTLVVRAANDRDEMWAIDQSLRCPAVAAVWASLAHLGRKLDTQCLRRWQLAAEQSGALGLLIRSAEARQLPCWSDAQLQASPCGGHGDEETWRLRVELLKVRGGAAGGMVQLELHAGQPWSEASLIPTEASA
jgi:hypothetical protein